MVDRNEILQKLKDMGLEPDNSLIDSNIVSAVDSVNEHQMFEDFKKILELHTDDSLAFKLGSLKKTISFPAGVCATMSEQKEMIDECNRDQIKPRYVIAKHLFRNLNIAWSSTISKTGNKATQFSEISRAFINFMSALEYQKASTIAYNEEDDEASDKLRSGVMKR